MPVPDSSNHAGTAARAQRASCSFGSLPDDALIRQRQLLRTEQSPNAPLPFSAQTLWRKVRNNTFPRPCKLSSRVTAWRVGDVRAWLAKHAAAEGVPQ